MIDRGEHAFLLSELIGLPAIVDEVGRGRIEDLAVASVDGKVKVVGLIVTSDGGADALIVCTNCGISRTVVSAETGGGMPAPELRPHRFHLGHLVFGKRMLDREEATVRVARDARLVVRAGELIVSEIDFEALPPRCSDVLAFVEAQMKQLLCPSACRTSVAIANVVIPALYAADCQAGGRLRPIDLAAILPEMATAERIAELGKLDAFDAVSVLLAATPLFRRDLIAAVSITRMVQLIEASTPARAVSLLSVLPLSDAECILEEVEGAHAERVRYLLWNRADKVIHFLSPCALELRSFDTVKEAILAYRQLDDTAAKPSELYIVDAERHLLGSVSLAELIASAPDTCLSTVMATGPSRLRQADRIQKASRLFQRYPVSSLPVVDHRDHLVGEIGEDEVAFVLGEFSELRSRY